MRGKWRWAVEGGGWGEGGGRLGRKGGEEAELGRVGVG